MGGTATRFARQPAPRPSASILGLRKCSNASVTEHQNLYAFTSNRHLFWNRNPVNYSLGGDLISAHATFTGAPMNGSLDHATIS